MKRKFCLVLTAVLCMSTALCSCGDKEDNTSSQGVINFVSEESTEVVSSLEVSSTVSESEVTVSNELTAEFEGDWQVFEIYQETKVSNISKEEGLAEEKSYANHIGNDFYEGYECHFDSPVYKIEEVKASVLCEEYGFSPENVEKDFGETVKMLTAQDGDGLDLGSGVYFLKGDQLVKFGAGAHLYLCQRVQAVG